LPGVEQTTLVTAPDHGRPLLFLEMRRNERRA
jgi:hypothetical protein